MIGSVPFDNRFLAKIYLSNIFYTFKNHNLKVSFDEKNDISIPF